MVQLLGFQSSASLLVQAGQPAQHSNRDPARPYLALSLPCGGLRTLHLHLPNGRRWGLLRSLKALSEHHVTLLVQHLESLAAAFAVGGSQQPVTQENGC